jgi:hypothetical protein
MSAEQRRHPRRKTLKSGKIIYHKGLRNQSCIVRDLSVSGAKLQIDAPFKCPEQFLLELLNEQPRACELAWEIGDMVGTKFTESADESDAPPRIQRWKSAWESGDPDRIAALYAADCRHHSPRLTGLCPEKAEIGLVSPDDIHSFAGKVFAAQPSAAVTIMSLTETRSRSVIEYELQTKTEANADNDNGDADTVDRLVEIIEWNGDLIREARVFQA